MSFHRWLPCKQKNQKRRISSNAAVPWQLTSPKKYKKTGNGGRIALYTLRGSLTVEASVILPLFLLGMIMLISVIDLCRVKINGQAELTQRAKKLSMYAYGTPGIYEDEYVDLFKIEAYDLPIKLIPFGKIKLALRARVHTWTGRSQSDGKNAFSQTDTTATMVYVTDRETVYHTDDNCSHLELSIYKAKKEDLSRLRNSGGRKYDACEKCCGDGMENTQYYLTKNGTTYHTSLNCSSLKRSCRMVKKTDAEHLEECSRCKGE